MRGNQSKEQYVTSLYEAPLSQLTCLSAFRSIALGLSGAEKLKSIRYTRMTVPDARTIDAEIDRHHDACTPTLCSPHFSLLRPCERPQSDNLLAFRCSEVTGTCMLS
jgi:hypothetical protein